MNLTAKAIDTLVSTPAGRTAYKKVLQPVVHLARRLTHPDLPLDRAMTKVSYRDKEFLIQRRRGHSSDQWAIDQCFTENQYDLPVGVHGVLVEDIYKEILASGRQPLILDCGANIGCSALWFSARYPHSHIVAIEPAPDNFEMLCVNCAGHDIDLRHAGVSGEDSVAHISDPGGGGWAYRTTTDGEGPEVAMVAISTLLASKPSSQYTPFLLKIDIEGHEKSLFSKDVSYLDQFPLIILEPHDWLFPGHLNSREFFRFHVDAGREFCMRHENVASVACHPRLMDMKNGFKN